MLSRHQKNVSDFFRENSAKFVEYLLHSTGNKVLILDDFYPHIVAFLDEFFRREIKLYVYQSQGYNSMQDMLIEIHIATRHSELYDTLMGIVAEAFTA